MSVHRNMILKLFKTILGDEKFKRLKSYNNIDTVVDYFYSIVDSILMATVPKLKCFLSNKYQC